jgi:hypothetical protein
MGIDFMRTTTRPDAVSNRGFSLTELVISMGITTIVMGVTMASLADVMRGNEMVMSIAAMNTGLRGGMDLMIRDLLQAGSGLPGSHTVSIPNGAGATPINLPGPPGTAFTTPGGALVLPAVVPWNGRGPTIGGVQTDVLTVLMADNAFLDVGLTAVGPSMVVVAPGPDLGNGPDRIVTGQLMMISKGSFTTLVQVTDVDVPARRLTFAGGDSLNLNQIAAEGGNLPALNAEAPINDPAATRISRIRMITYYLDFTTDPARPRLVRRINNGHPTLFQNTLGTAVATDTYDLQFTYDVSNGINNPADIAMDYVGGGIGCGGNPCDPEQIRKVNLQIMVRSPNQVQGQSTFLSNTLESQVSLRAMAFVDRFR